MGFGKFDKKNIPTKENNKRFLAPVSNLQNATPTNETRVVCHLLLKINTCYVELYGQCLQAIVSPPKRASVGFVFFVNQEHIIKVILEQWAPATHVEM